MYPIIGFIGGGRGAVICIKLVYLTVVYYLGFNGDLLEYKFIVEFDVFLLLKNDLIKPQIFPFKLSPTAVAPVLLTPIGNNS